MENFFRVAMNGDFRFLDIYLHTNGLLSCIPLMICESVILPEIYSVKLIVFNDSDKLCRICAKGNHSALRQSYHSPTNVGKYHKDLFAKPKYNIANELDGSTEPSLF